MAQWYVKDLSKLTGVSVQTLHHYDRIDLLKPSVRLDNGYRIYSEKDLLKLQQIIALKFFGFELSQIKALIICKAGTLEHFENQAQLLEKKANVLQDASKALRSIISDVKDNNSIPWETVIKLIEVYRMTQKLDHSWVKEIFTPEELKEYVTFETELKSNSSPGQKVTFEKNWTDLVEEIKMNIHHHPESELGIHLAEKCMAMINGLYGKKYAHLRTKKFEKGFIEGKGLVENGLKPEIVAWLEKAMDAYWKGRIYSVLEQVGIVPPAETLKLWDALLSDMYGEDFQRKEDLLNMAINDSKVSQDAKKWLKSLSPESF